MIEPRSPVSRRTTLGIGLGAAGLLVLSGCGMSVRTPGSASESPSGRRTIAGRPDPDVQVVVDLLAAYEASIAVLTSTTARHPGLAGRLTPLLAVERAHLAELRRAAPSDRASTTPPAAFVAPAKAGRALRAALASSVYVRRHCYASAGRAQSGSFARLLAAMGAALSQRLPGMPAADRALTRGQALSHEVTGDVTGIDALQTTLAGEHAAVYVYGVLAAQTSESDQPERWADLDAAYDAHRTSRDVLVQQITAARQTPVAAAASYDLPNAVSTTAQVTRAALVTEQRMTDTYGALVAQTTGWFRRWATGSLDRSAVRQLRFGGRPEVFPGTGGVGSRSDQRP